MQAERMTPQEGRDNLRERYEAYLRENPMWRELEEQEQERDSLATIFLSLLSVAMLAYGILFLAAN